VAHDNLPGVLKKRGLLNEAKAAPADIKALAEALAAADRLSDAIDFMRKAGDQAGLDSLVDRVVAEGDYFLALKIEQARGLPLTDEVWRQVADKARAMGKEAFAAQALGRIQEAETDD
jgi:hypothetical protein